MVVTQIYISQNDKEIYIHCTTVSIPVLFFFKVTQDLSIRSNWAKSTQHPALFYFIFVNLLFLWTSCESIVISKNKQWVQSQMSETSGRIFYILSNETILPHFNGPKVNTVHIFIGYFENKEKQSQTHKIINFLFISRCWYSFPIHFHSISWPFESHILRLPLSDLYNYQTIDPYVLFFHSNETVHSFRKNFN